MRAALLTLVLFPFALFADVTQPLPDSALWPELLSFLQNLPMAGMALAVAVSQLVLVFMRTSYGSFAGKWKLVAVTGLSLVATVLTALASGGSFLEALFAGPTIAAVQVFIHQLMKKFSSPEPGQIINPIG